MLGLVLPIIAAIGLALALGGSFAGWTRQHVAWWPAIPLALLAQVLIFSPPLDQHPWIVAAGAWIWVGAMLVVMVVLLRNAILDGARRAAWIIAALGVCLNILVVVANGGVMPRDPGAGAIAGSETASAASERLTNVTDLDAESRFQWFADIIPQPAWLPMANVVSAGDLILSGGVAWWAFQVTMSERRRDPRRSLATFRRGSSFQEE